MNNLSRPRSSRTRLGAWVVMLLFLSLASLPTHAQDKKKPAPPRVTVILPLGAAAGKTTKLTVRGHGLDKATSVHVEHGKAKLISKGNAPVPDKNPDQVGATQIVAEVTLEKTPGNTVNVTVTTPQGTTQPHPLLVGAALPVKEPNEGFKEAQPLTLPVVLEGVIERPRDVDVFRFTGKKGQKLVAEVLAQRYGSPLDAMLTLYNSAGQQVAFSDDRGPETRDARIETVLPADGAYYLTLIDAHDAGSAIHAYRLAVR